MINSKEISVILQGAIDEKNTPKCLNSVRNILPNSEIILSTWEGSNIDNLDYDKIILNKDPGSFKMSPFETSNIRRQILSTVNGLKSSERKYCLKIRSDIKILNANFLNYFDNFNDFDKEWHFLNSKIIIPNLYARDPRIWESPMCPSDWAAFGLKEDMLNLWDVAFPTEEEENWFNIHNRPEEVNYYYDILVSRFNPEQFIWCNFIKKHREIKTNHMFDITNETIEETLKSFANNLIIISMQQFGLELTKPERTDVNKWHIITYKEFLKIYNKYANGKKRIPLLNVERLLLINSFKQSYHRLYKKAKQNKQLKPYIYKEISFYASSLYKIISAVSPL